MIKRAIYIVLIFILVLFASITNVYAVPKMNSDDHSDDRLNLLEHEYTVGELNEYFKKNYDLTDTQEINTAIWEVLGNIFGEDAEKFSDTLPEKLNEYMETSIANKKLDDNTIETMKNNLDAVYNTDLYTIYKNRGNNTSNIIKRTKDVLDNINTTRKGGDLEYTGTFSFPSIGDLFRKAKGFIDEGSKTNTFTDEGMAGIVTQIAGFLMGIAFFVLAIVSLIMAIKYMISNPDDKAKLKQQLIGLAISAAVIFGAYTIWQVTVNIMNNVTG